MHTRNIRLDIEYDGTDFSGWQVQPNTRTVQGVLEDALSDLAGEPIRPVGSGRTDAGVHALGQVAHAETSLALPPDEIASALNARLPEDVLVKRAQDVPVDFHARFSAVSRTYVYLIGLSPSPVWRRHRWHVSYRLDLGAMKAAADKLRVSTDFSSFCLTGSEPSHHRCQIRAISLESHDRFGGLLVFEITADRFLRGMVRSIVGTLVEVGRGEMPAEEIESIIEARDRSRAGPSAPAKGLYLVRVSYD